MISITYVLVKALCILFIIFWLYLGKTTFTSPLILFTVTITKNVELRKDGHLLIHSRKEMESFRVTHSFSVSYDYA